MINIRINAKTSTSDALAKIDTFFKDYDPGVSFQYSFVDQDYGA